MVDITLILLRPKSIPNYEYVGKNVRIVSTMYNVQSSTVKYLAD